MPTDNNNNEQSEDIQTMEKFDNLEQLSAYILANQQEKLIIFNSLIKSEKFSNLIHSIDDFKLTINIFNCDLSQKLNLLKQVDHKKLFQESFHLGILLDLFPGSQSDYIIKQYINLDNIRLQTTSFSNLLFFIKTINNSIIKEYLTGLDIKEYVNDVNQLKALLDNMPDNHDFLIEEELGYEKIAEIACISIGSFHQVWQLLNDKYREKLISKIDSHKLLPDLSALNRLFCLFNKEECGYLLVYLFGIERVKQEINNIDAVSSFLSRISNDAAQLLINELDMQILLSDLKGLQKFINSINKNARVGIIRSMDPLALCQLIEDKKGFFNLINNLESLEVSVLIVKLGRKNLLSLFEQATIEDFKKLLSKIDNQDLKLKLIKLFKSYQCLNRDSVNAINLVSLKQDLTPEQFDCMIKSVGKTRLLQIYNNSYKLKEFLKSIKTNNYRYTSFALKNCIEINSLKLRVLGSACAMIGVCSLVLAGFSIAIAAIPAVSIFVLGYATLTSIITGSSLAAITGTVGTASLAFGINNLYQNKQLSNITEDVMKQEHSQLLLK